MNSSSSHRFRMTFIFTRPNKFVAPSLALDPLYEKWHSGMRLVFIPVAQCQIRCKGTRSFGWVQKPH